MELATNQVLNVLEDLLVEQVLRDHLIRHLSAVEGQDSEDVYLISGSYSLLIVCAALVGKFLGVSQLLLDLQKVGPPHSCSQ